jgi:hypothetical protein
VTATEVAADVVYPGSSPLLLARVPIDVNGTTTYLQQVHLTSITYEVRSDGAVVGSGTIPVVGSVYDALQVGTTWTRKLGPLGGNFGWRLPAAMVPDANKRYAVKVTFNLTGGTAFFAEWSLLTVSPTR